VDVGVRRTHTYTSTTIPHIPHQETPMTTSSCDSHKFAPSNKRLVFSYSVIKHETKKAYLVGMYKRELWLPKSYTIIIKRHHYLTLPVWIAAEKGLIKAYNVQDFGDAEAAMGSFKKAIVYEYERLVPPCTINFREYTGGE